MKRLSVLALFLLLCACRCLAAPLPDQTAAAQPGSIFHVPYRLDTAEHLLVRAKLNGKGPYNFILDTGAPALFVSADIADKIGVKAAADGWGVFDRVEVEGGAVLEKVRARIEFPAQLQGMNALGLAGVHIDGVVGFNLLSQFRIEIDLTQPKMIWTWQPGLVAEPMSAKEAANSKAVPTEGMDQMEKLMKTAGAMFGQKGPPPAPVPRGFFGMELGFGKALHPTQATVVTAILAGSPAAQAGMKSGDKIISLAIGTDPAVTIQGRDDLMKQAAAISAGTTAHFTILRNSRKMTLSIVAGRGGL